MDAKVLSHALVAVPRIPTQSLPPVRLGFQPSPHFLRPTRLVLHPLSTAAPRRSFVVRAEEEPAAGGEPEEASDVVEDAGEAGEGAVAVLEGGEEEEEVKEPRKPRVKLGEIMGILNKKAIEASDEVRPIPDIRVGDVVLIKLAVPSNRRRLAMYRGIVISRQNAGIHTTIRIRRIIAGIGVEIVFPIYSPLIKEIQVMSHRKVRRARLYYLRDKLPRFSTFK